MLPHQEFFYTFDDLGESPSATHIRRACPDGERRQHAFKHFYDLQPDDVRYLHGYLAAYVKMGVYDQQQFKHCFDLIDAGHQLRDRSGCHDKLRKLKIDLERQQAEMLVECGPDPPVDTDTPWFQFRSGNFDPIMARYSELKTTVQPRGILGPPQEKEFWVLSQFMIRIALMKRETADALARLHEYEQGRIAVKLTPMPAHDIQEAILGYHSAQNVDEALKKLKFWLDNSRMPIVSDVIRDHPAFSHLFADWAY